MTLKKRSTSGIGNPLWYCESCQKTYTNQAQAIRHLTHGHQMARPYAEGLLQDLQEAHGIRARAATR